jgi:hypothetical protein
LFRGRFFIGPFARGIAFGAEGVAVLVEHFGLIARGAERTPLQGLALRSCRSYLTSALLLLGLGSNSGLRTRAPIPAHLQICCPQLSLVEARSLGVRRLRHLALAVLTLDLAAGLFAARLLGARRALTDDGCLPLDALLSQPMQGFEGIAVSHSGQCSKATGPRAIHKIPVFPGIYSASAERACHSCKLFTSWPFLSTAEISSASTAAAPAAMVVKYGTFDKSALRRIE